MVADKCSVLAGRDGKQVISSHLLSALDERIPTDYEEKANCRRRADFAWRERENKKATGREKLGEFTCADADVRHHGAWHVHVP